MTISSGKTFLVCHGAWGAGYGWRKMHPLMADFVAEVGGEVGVRSLILFLKPSVVSRRIVRVTYAVV